MRAQIILTLALVLTLGSATGCGRAKVQPGAPAEPPPAASAEPTSGGPAAKLPRPDHVLIVVEENRGYDQIIGSADAPYINQLAREGALFTDSHGVTHPSQPNYLALFSGAPQGVTDDSCPQRFSGSNLATELAAAGLTFTGYSESMPQAGFTGCEKGPYKRKHNPWVDFSNVPADLNQPFTSFPADYSRLPTVSFVVPDQNNDMHDGSIKAADQWLRAHLGGYVAWARAHNSLLILTFDEDEGHRAEPNRIPTIFVGAGVRPIASAGRIDHTNVLGTIEAMYGLTGGGRRPITGIWQ